MKQQKEMEASFSRMHSDFIDGLSNSLDVLDEDISEAKEMHHICTDEWCQATESYLDELAKMVYSISEPRWQSDEDSAKIRKLRERIRELYAQYKGTQKK